MTPDALDELLSRPAPGVAEALARCSGDIVVLGAGGKMGPSLARMARRAASELGDGRRIIAVSRFGSREAEEALRAHGVETVRCDLLDRASVARLPDAPNVIFMAGQKFGTRDAPASTWAMNVLVPAIAAERYAGSRIVAFSTGNVYPLTPAARGGAREDDVLAPVGEYAQSCVGRERILEHFAARDGTPVAIVRLNYAIALRYGVLTDIALAVARGEPIDLAMGHVNVIWQGDANARALRCLPHAAVPPFVVNVTGGETLSVRALAERLGALLGRAPRFAGSEAEDALLSSTARSDALFGPPEVPLERMLEWAAEWVRAGGEMLGKPTHFGERAGAF
ncbi:MAG TPA: NAD(P)-dependent oxidoreductase [Gemmatimonadaceae bacterium]|nr:NAD(P)-dependent oxidoreductase [Gemmatimonadaceae bacterium]